MNLRNSHIPQEPKELTAKAIRRLIQARRARGIYLGEDLFSDPAWDVLLEAYVRHLDQTRISVSELCDASGVPTTTALRWIKRLEEDGWLLREKDPLDARRYWLQLSKAGSQRLCRYFQAIGPILKLL
jgi:DNA-binding MarR family transcriptional regulator